ncbi:MAG: aminotransferase class I/II-fold pyridoxal phosphate-dependent enzyme [Pseudomonadota bacterium]
MLDQERIPVLKPLLPPHDAIVPFLKEIDDSRWYANHGPMITNFEAGLAQTMDVLPHAVACMSNGTLAIAVALRAAGALPGARCLLPSWTFIGTAAAVLTAGLEPHFVDVDSKTWALDPDTLLARDDLDSVGAVVVVAPFGAPVDRASWDHFTEKTGIPVVIDAAAAIDAIASAPAMAAGPTPMAVSLHATKTLGIGEGGFIVCTDSDLMQRARQIGNFGFYSISVAQMQGWNAKISEYSAAVGLACIQEWPQKRDRWERITQQYKTRLQDIEGVTIHPTYGTGWVSSYCCVRTTIDCHRLADQMDRHAIDTRRWWRSGCHAHPGYMSVPRDPLPATKALATSTIGLPFSVDMTTEQVDRVCETVSDLLADR